MRGPFLAGVGLFCCVGWSLRPVAAAVVVTQRQALTTDPEADVQPSLSPDGQQIVFASARDGNMDLWIMARDGTNPRQLTFSEGVNVYCDDPQWSPQGDWIVYTSNKGQTGSLDLWLIRPGGEEDHPLTTDASVDWMPTWSPDGQQIAFISDRDGRDSLWLMDATGERATKVMEDVWDPAWSPDGQRMAFYSIRGEKGEEGIWVMNLQEQQPRLILARGEEPAWSPDGRYVICARNGEEQVKRLWIVDTQLGTDAPLEGGQGRQASPCWSRDGQALVYDSDESGNKDLWISLISHEVPVAVILSPQANETVSGTVPVLARIGGEGIEIQSYRLEYGVGEQPEAWTLITEGAGAKEGEVAKWDTATLTGAGVLRLTAVDAAGEATVVQVPVMTYGEYGVVFGEQDLPAEMLAGEVYNVTLHLRNVGSMTWRKDGPFRVTGNYRWFDLSGRLVSSDSLVAPLPRDVSNGEELELPARIGAPLQAGTFVLRWDLQQGGQLWFAERGTQPLEITVAVAVSYAVEYRIYNAPKTMVPGQIYTVDVTLRNLGASAWPAGVAAEAGAPPDAPALGYRWKDSNGAIVETELLRTYLPREVQPGDTVKLRAQIQAPSVGGDYTVAWDLVRGEEEWFSERYHCAVATTPVTVRALYAAEFVEEKTPSRMFPGELYTASVRVRNTGSLPWKLDGQDAVHLTYRWLDGQGQAVVASQLMTPLTYEVPPGGEAELAAQAQAPGQPGEYTLEWDMARAGGFRFSEHGSPVARVSVKVGSQTHSVEFVSHDHLSEMVVGEMYSVRLKLANTGAMTWSTAGEGEVKLGYHWLDESGREAALEPILTPLGREINQSESVELAARVQAPLEPGQYTLKWDLLQGQQTWFSTVGSATLNVPVLVKQIYGVKYLSHDTPTTMVAGQRYTVNVRLQNTGTIDWETDGPVPVGLTCRWLNEEGEIVPLAQTITFMPNVVKPGDTADVRTFVRAPDTAGAYTLQWDLKHGEELWFSEEAAPPLTVPVEVR